MHTTAATPENKSEKKVKKGVDYFRTVRYATPMTVRTESNTNTEGGKMNINDLKAGDFVAYTSDRGCFDGVATRYGKVIEIRGTDAICRFGRMTMRLTTDDQDNDSITGG